MRLILIDKNHTGAARYFPTFNHAFYRIKCLLSPKPQLMKVLSESSKCISKMKKSQKYVEFVASLLNGGNLEIRSSAIIILYNAAHDSVNISVAIPDIIKRLNDKDVFIKLKAVSILHVLAKNKIDIAPAVPFLVNMLFDSNLSKFALLGSGSDMSDEIYNALKYVIIYGSPKYSNKIAHEIMKYSRSKGTTKHPDKDSIPPLYKLELFQLELISKLLDMAVAFRLDRAGKNK